MSQLTEQIEQLVQPLLEDLGFELVDLEYQREQRGWILRLFLDKEGGITLDDCADASREISSLLDVEDLIATAYTLEVSSPGIERSLKKASDFSRFSGETIKVKTFSALDPAQTGKPRRTFVGTLTGCDGDKVMMTLQEGKTKDVQIALQDIEKANLKIDF